MLGSERSLFIFSYPTPSKWLCQTALCVLKFSQQKQRATAALLNMESRGGEERCRSDSPEVVREKWDKQVKTRHASALVLMRHSRLHLPVVVPF